MLKCNQQSKAQHSFLYSGFLATRASNAASVARASAPIRTAFARSSSDQCAEGESDGQVRQSGQLVAIDSNKKKGALRPLNLTERELDLNDQPSSVIALAETVTKVMPRLP